MNVVLILDCIANLECMSVRPNRNDSMIEYSRKPGVSQTQHTNNAMPGRLVQLPEQRGAVLQKVNVLMLSVFLVVAYLVSIKHIKITCSHWEASFIQHQIVH